MGRGMEGECDPAAARGCRAVVVAAAVGNSGCRGWLLPLGRPAPPVALSAAEEEENARLEEGGRDERRESRDGVACRRLARLLGWFFVAVRGGGPRAHQLSRSAFILTEKSVLFSCGHLSPRRCTV